MKLSFRKKIKNSENKKHFSNQLRIVNTNTHHFQLLSPIGNVLLKYQRCRSIANTRIRKVSALTALIVFQKF